VQVISAVRAPHAILVENVHGSASMRLTRRGWLGLAFVLGVTMLLVPVDASAVAREANGYYLTGTGVRQKKVALFTADVYVISHYMRDLPPTKSKRSVVDSEVDKMFALRMVRDVSIDQIQGALREAYAMNGYDDRAKIDAFVAVFTRPLHKDSTVTIRYDAASKTTMVRATGTAQVTVPGVDFMTATWSIWFGRIDQPGLGDALIDRVP
jgi:hypothetical protein